MKLLPILTLCVLALLGLASCDKVLDKTDLGSVNGSLIFKDSTLARMNLDYIYDQNLPTWGGTWGLRGDLSDESYGESKFFEGTLVVNDVTDFGTALSPSNNYGKIRLSTCLSMMLMRGLLLSHQNRLNAQAYFFRAWRYFDLVRLYGGVPLVLKPLQAVGVEARDLAFYRVIPPLNVTTKL
ncbi:MAG: hypothetical protein R2822_21255 [Spirosomataceae bacterium]